MPNSSVVLTHRRPPPRSPLPPRLLPSKSAAACLLFFFFLLSSRPVFSPSTTKFRLLSRLAARSLSYMPKQQQSKNNYACLQSWQGFGDKTFFFFFPWCVVNRTGPPLFRSDCPALAASLSLRPPCSRRLSFSQPVLP